MAESLADQLRPHAARLRGNAPTLRQLLQVTGDLVGDDKVATVNMARQQALMWAKNRVGRLPDQAWNFQDFDHLMPGASASAITLKREEENIDYWIMRCDDPDKEVAGRTWTTEITVALQRDRAAFGLRLMVATRGGIEDIVPAVPGVVRQIAEAPGIVRSARIITENPIFVSSADELEDLLDLIESPRRRRSVYVISLNERSEELSSATINAVDLAKRCIGTAHVAVVPAKFTYGISDRFGKQFSVFWGAVRTYRPGFDVSTDSPFAHPRALVEAIEEWEGVGPKAFEALLIKSAAADSLTRISAERELPSYAQVKQSALARRRENLSTAGDDTKLELEIAKQEIKEKDTEVNEWEQMALEEQEKRLQLEGQFDELNGQVFWLKQRAESLEATVKNLSGGKIEVPIPDDYESMAEWANEHLAGKLFLSKRAIRSAKGAQFEDITLVYSSLLLLANEYHSMRMGEGKEGFEAKLQELGLECSQTFAGGRAGEHGDMYFIDYDGRRRELNMHLKNGNARNARRCMRIYFFWDEDRGQVVVGSLPAHLDTRAT